MSTKTTSVRRLSVGIAATLLLSVSPVALHAETSNAELAKEIAELKAQIHAMRGAIAETRTETRKTSAKVRSAGTTVVAAPAPLASKLPDGAVPVFVTANKQMQFGSLTITPGGFTEATGVYRSKNTQSDIATAFNAIPTNNSNLSRIGESRITARQSRVAMLIEAPITPSVLVAGYGEFDFYGSFTSSNNGQTFGYGPRIRHLYTTLDLEDYGIHLLTGQTWSLLVPNSKGITPRNEVIVPEIDGGFVPGFNYARIPQVRLVKDFNKKLWLAASVEAPGTAYSGCNAVVGNQSTTSTIAAGAAVTGASLPPTAIAANGATNVTCLSVGNGNFGQTGQSQQLSLNQLPDFQVKAAYEIKLADRDVHIEANGVYRNQLTYVNYGLNGGAAVGYGTSSRQSTDAYGITANLIAPIIPKKLDLAVGGMFGRGMGRYTSTGLPDATIDGNGNAKAIPIFTGVVTLTGHVTPAIDLYVSAGIDQVTRATSNNGTIGYGVTAGQNNTGCNVLGGTCTGVTHRVWQLAGGMWDKIYKGSFGEVRVGAMYSYTKRDLFSTAAVAGGPLVGASTNEHIVMTTLRYYPFQ